ncbi:probable xyloglucan endotransglucosylase/hydrolase protein 10 isoform X2 [Typha latifolia]|uniref:probable xyloglucan endotransglucosylase/hydrolase protein 10 isoform X2 n=1 Tax=Typha latifolia TaxID=4733 RepID=UPI003C2CA888
MIRFKPSFTMSYKCNISTLIQWLSLAYLIRNAFASVISTGNFNDDFYITWSANHINTSADGHSRSLKLDQDSGSSFASNDMFLFGEIDMQIKLVPGYSAGTVVAFYPYILQTNIYADGFDNREERIYLWFDPTEDFHTYSILWNLHQIVFMVDWVPIRLYRNHEDKGVAFPMWQPMSLKVSLWSGNSWATRGGRDKVDWSKGPFIASFRNYRIDACVWKGNPIFCRAESSTNWWNNPRFSSLTWSQRRLFKWVRKYHLIYDYCQDSTRFQGQLPRECSLPKY